MHGQKTKTLKNTVCLTARTSAKPVEKLPYQCSILVV